jgi:hypothetical protein
LLPHPYAVYFIQDLFVSFKNLLLNTFAGL